MARGRSLDLRSDPEADLSAVVAHVAGGGVVAYPTETVYGFGSACTAKGVQAVTSLKVRAPTQPLIALVPDRAHVADLEWTTAAREVARVFWPGSLTLVLNDPRRIFPPGVRSEAGSVAVRVSPHATVRRLLDLLGGPIISTSANLPGQSPARSGDEAAAVVLALGGDEVWLLDQGPLPQSAPSTILDCTGDAPVVLRVGTVPIERIRCLLPEIQ